MRTHKHMGYKSREKKRQATRRAVTATKKQHATVMRGRWYLTIVQRKTCCAVCAGILNVGAEMVFRKEPLEARCKLCGEHLKPRPSRTWEKWRNRQHKVARAQADPPTVTRRDSHHKTKGNGQRATP